MFTIVIVDDDVMEFDETFTVTLLSWSVTTCAVTISDNSRTEVMITDDDGRQRDSSYNVCVWGVSVFNTTIKSEIFNDNKLSRLVESIKI